MAENGSIKLIPVDHGFTDKIKVNSKLDGKETTINWWSNDAPFYYDSMLVSTFYGKEIPNYRDYYNIPRKNFTLYGDSGGFQNSSQSANLNSVNVLNWQQENCDIGFILDWPISPSTSAYDFEIKQKRTLENAELALTKWTNKDMKLYAVIHGRNAVEIKTMITQYGDLSRFSGISLGSIVPKKSDYMYVANICMLFLEAVKDYKLPIHFFGIGGVNTLPIIAYLSKKYKLNCTTDAAGHGIGFSHRKYWNPYNLSGNIMQFGEKDTESFHPENLPCNCPVCTKIGENLIDLVKNQGNSAQIGSIISLHNVYSHIQYTKMISSYNQTDRLLKGLVKNICTDSVNNALEFIDYSLENGIDEGHKKYFDGENPKPSAEINNSLFDF